MDLYLVRHGIAGQRDLQRWPDDRERPLTREGIARFQSAARGLARVVPRVEVLLSSPLKRAWQTAEILEEVAGWPAPKVSDLLASGAEPRQMLEALEPYAAAASVALVGHEPDLTACVSYLIGSPERELRIEMKKGGVAYLRFEESPSAGTATLRWLMPPAVLRSLRP